MLLALFGIGNDTLNLVVNLLVLSLVVVYFALVAWTYFDARRRMEDPVLVASSVGASFVFPFIGTVVYSILRPPDFLEDAHEREVEIRAAELRVRQLTEQSCPKCDYPIEKTFLRCPSCRSRLKDPCAKCGKPVDPRWALCPYCEAPIGRPAPERRAPSREGREAKPSREGKQSRERKPSREGKASREARPARERPERRAPSAEPRTGAKSSKRSGERRKSAGDRPQRAPAPSGSGSGAGSSDSGKGEQREPKQEAGSRATGGASDEERSRPATAS